VPGCLPNLVLPAYRIRLLQHNTTHHLASPLELHMNCIQDVVPHLCHYCHVVYCQHQHCYHLLKRLFYLLSEVKANQQWVFTSGNLKHECPAVSVGHF